MTKTIKYGKINFMKTQKTNKFKTIFISILFLALTLSVIGLISVNKVNANSSVTPELVLPNSNLEYYQLTSPIDAYSDESITAILQDEQIILYKNGNYQTPISNTGGYLTALKQVKKLDDDNLIFSSNGNIYTLTLSTGIIAEFMPAFPSIGGNYFDFNDDYFVTVYGTTANYYTFSNGQITDGGDYFTFEANGDNSIAINQNNEIFYIKDNKLQKRTINQTGEFLPIEVSPSKIIANDEYAYYLHNNKIYRISVSGNSLQELTSPNSEFDLGKIVNPTSITFKGENLLVTGDNSIQEFRVTEDNKLEFTGFAIAKGKTAYNRISSTVVEIERQKDNVAILDGDKLSLITVGENFDRYDKNNFEHFDLSTTLINDGKTPQAFAFGENSALLLYDKGLDQSPLAVYDFDTKTLNTQIPLNNKITDLTYQSGKYYALAHKNITNASEIYVSAEKDINFTLLTSVEDLNASIMEVDVFGNLYLYASDGNIYKLDKSTTEQPTKITSSPITNAKKLETDLGGNLFVLTDNSIHSYNGSAWTEITVDGATDLNSFAMDFDRKIVYLVCQNQEVVLSTSALTNLAINELVPTTFNTTSENASDNLQTYKAKDGANIYSVTKTESGNFVFNKLITEQTDYAFITQVEKDGVILFALVGQTDIVLINKDEVIETTPNKDVSVPKTAFITTAVSGYYLPIITENSDYALSVNGDKLRLNKEQIINPKHKTTFLNKDYYFAEFTVNETTYLGYIPIDYTIKVLSQDFVWDNYTIEEISSTTVYQEKELTTEITQLENGTSVRVINITDGVAYIAFETQSGYVNGYIDASAIKDEPNIAIRNILIIIAVMASVCGTTSYFILRKKK